MYKDRSLKRFSSFSPANIFKKNLKLYSFFLVFLYKTIFEKPDYLINFAGKDIPK